MVSNSGKKCPKCGSAVVIGGSYCPRCGSRIFDGMEGDAASDPYIGMVIDDTFEIQSILGTGSMGIVYKAYHRALRCVVALKILRHDFLNDRIVQARFQREAQAASCLSHPNIIRIMHFGRTKLNAPYIAMEYLNGKELSSLIPDQFPLTPRRICRIASQTARALSAAHSANIIHRDLKPANIIIINQNGEEFVKVLDFGIAKITDVEGEGLTREGAICGTPAFMSPEQVLGRKITPQADIFSLGSTMYFMLTCLLPFKGDSMVDVSKAIMTTNPTPPSQARLDCYVAPELERICLRALEKDPAERFQSASDMANALDKVYDVLPEVAPAVKPRIVVAPIAQTVNDNISGETRAMDVYEEESTGSELEEAGTVVDMSAYQDSSTSDILATDPQNTNPVRFAASQVLRVVAPAKYAQMQSSPQHTAINVTQRLSPKEQLLQSRKRLLLGFVCIIASLCLLSVLLMSLISYITRPASVSSPKIQSESQEKEPTPKVDLGIYTDAIQEPSQYAVTLAVAYGVTPYSKRWRGSDIGADSIDAAQTDEQKDSIEPSKETAKPNNDEPAPKVANNGTPKTASKTTKTTTNTSKTTTSKDSGKSSKTTASKSSKTSSSKTTSTTAKKQIAQAERLESSGDKKKACQMYRQILSTQNLEQGDKIKIQAKVRSCGRISI